MLYLDQSVSTVFCVIDRQYILWEKKTLMSYDKKQLYKKMETPGLDIFYN